MAYSARMTAALSGATMRQLGYWRRTPPLLVPEISRTRPILYSFRDVLALRAFVRLREEISLQAIRLAVGNLTLLGKRGHLSSHQLLAKDGTVVLVDARTGALVDLKKHPGQIILPFTEIVEPFEAMMDKSFPTERVLVPDLLQPRDHISVDPDILAGSPVITGTRVPFEMVAGLVRDGVPAGKIKEFWPAVTARAARDAVSFADYVDLFDPERAIA